MRALELRINNKARDFIDFIGSVVAIDRI